jgi:hypothetical protein
VRGLQLVASQGALAAPLRVGVGEGGKWGLAAVPPSRWALGRAGRGGWRLCGGLWCRAGCAPGGGGMMCRGCCWLQGAGIAGSWRAGAARTLGARHTHRERGRARCCCCCVCRQRGAAAGAGAVQHAAGAAAWGGGGGVRGKGEGAGAAGRARMHPATAGCPPFCRLRPRSTRLCWQPMWCWRLLIGMQPPAHAVPPQCPPPFGLPAPLPDRTKRRRWSCPMHSGPC